MRSSAATTAPRTTAATAAHHHPTAHHPTQDDQIASQTTTQDPHAHPTQPTQDPLARYLMLEEYPREDVYAACQRLAETGWEDGILHGGNAIVLNAFVHPPNTSFVSLMKQLYQVELFHSQTALPGRYEDAILTSAINTWASIVTHRQVPRLLKSYNPSADVLLLNTVSSKVVRWKYPFASPSTRMTMFHLSPRLGVPVPFMHQTSDFYYCRGPAYEAVELIYANENYSMVLLRPTTFTDLAPLEAALSPAMVTCFQQDMKLRHLRLKVPSFCVSHECSLLSCFDQLGVPVHQPLRHINGQANLSVGDIKHQAMIDVSHLGTRPVAYARAVIGGAGRCTSTPVLKFDVPFIFYVTQRSSNTLVYLGRVMNPSLSSSRSQ